LTPGCSRRSTRSLKYFPAFVGQQVDVFIKAPSRSAATKNPTSGHIFFGEPPNGRTAAVVIAGQGAR
jgi:hypothetical protein